MIKPRSVKQWICEQCGAAFLRPACRTGVRFCSRHCYFAAPRRSKGIPRLAQRIPDGQPMSRGTQYRRRKAAGLTKPKKHNPINPAFFATWSDDLAWLLGLVWSDGCLQGNYVSITSKDRDLLETVAHLVGKNTSGITAKNGGTAWSIALCSKEVTDRWRLLGLTEAKSLTAPWPDIPPQHQAAFVRGLLDGDGTVYLHQTRAVQQAPDLSVGWVGAAPAVRDGLAAWLSSQNLRHSVGISHHNVWIVRVAHQESLHTLYHLLYPRPDVPALKRKQTAYEFWIQTPRARPGRRRMGRGVDP